MEFRITCVIGAPSHCAATRTINLEKAFFIGYSLLLFIYP